MGVYVVRTSSLNDKHSCQLFRKASSLVLLSSSVCRHGQPKLFARDHFLQLGFSSTSPRFNLLRVDSLVFCFHFRVLSSIFSLSFLCSSVSEALFTLSFSYLSERFFFVHDETYRHTLEKWFPLKSERGSFHIFFIQPSPPFIFAFL